MAIEIVDLPVKNGLFSVCYVNVYQTVNLHFPMVFLWFSNFPIVFLWFSLGISTSGLKTRGRQRGKDVAAPDDAIAAHVQETEGDAQAALGAGGDLWKVENPMWFLWDLMVLFNGIFNEMYDFV